MKGTPLGPPRASNTFHHDHCKKYNNSMSPAISPQMLYL